MYFVDHWHSAVVYAAQMLLLKFSGKIIPYLLKNPVPGHTLLEFQRDLFTLQSRNAWVWQTKTWTWPLWDSFAVIVAVQLPRIFGDPDRTKRCRSLNGWVPPTECPNELLRYFEKGSSWEGICLALTIVTAIKIFDLIVDLLFVIEIED